MKINKFSLFSTAVCYCFVSALWPEAHGMEDKDNELQKAINRGVFDGPVYLNKNKDFEKCKNKNRQLQDANKDEVNKHLQAKRDEYIAQKKSHEKNDLNKLKDLNKEITDKHENLKRVHEYLQGVPEKDRKPFTKSIDEINSIHDKLTGKKDEVTRKKDKSLKEDIKKVGDERFHQKRKIYDPKGHYYFPTDRSLKKTVDSLQEKNVPARHSLKTEANVLIVEKTSKIYDKAISDLYPNVVIGVQAAESARLQEKIAKLQKQLRENGISPQPSSSESRAEYRPSSKSSHTSNSYEKKQAATSSASPRSTERGRASQVSSSKSGTEQGPRSRNSSSQVSLSESVSEHGPRSKNSHTSSVSEKEKVTTPPSSSDSVKRAAPPPPPPFRSAQPKEPVPQMGGLLDGIKNGKSTLRPVVNRLQPAPIEKPKTFEEMMKESLGIMRRDIDPTS